MFVGVIIDRVNGLLAAEKSPQSIADAVTAYTMESGLYEAVSRRSSPTLASIQVPVVWADFVEKWLDGSRSAIDSLLANSLPKIDQQHPRALLMKRLTEAEGAQAKSSIDALSTTGAQCQANTHAE
jgi:hypothetical protein